MHLSHLMKLSPQINGHTLLEASHCGPKLSPNRVPGSTGPQSTSYNSSHHISNLDPEQRCFRAHGL